MATTNNSRQRSTAQRNECQTDLVCRVQVNQKRGVSVLDPHDPGDDSRNRGAQEDKSLTNT